MIVDLTPTEDQAMIAESLGALLADRLPVERLRDPASHGGGGERAAWPQLVEMGLFGLGLPEDRGGIGYGLPEEVLAARALGRHLASPSLLAQMAAPHLAEEADVRAAFTAGKATAAFALDLGDGSAQLFDAEDATQLVFLSDAIALLKHGDFSPAEARGGLDETVCVSQTRAPATDARRSDAADRLSLLLAAYLVGVAQGATEMAVEYAKTREQFGQPIGAFQAVKHMCADMAVRAAAAEAQTFHAAAAWGLGLDDRAEAASARLLAGDTALANARANIQIHGGMGFTAECDAHLFLKRAHLMSMLGSRRGREQRRILGLG